MRVSRLSFLQPQWRSDLATFTPMPGCRDGRRCSQDCCAGLRAVLLTRTLLRWVRIRDATFIGQSDDVLRRQSGLTGKRAE
jgi:hypothetical protein